MTEQKATPTTLYELLHEMEANPAASANPVSTWVLDLRRLLREQEANSVHFHTSEKAFIRKAMKDALVDMQAQVNGVVVPDALTQRMTHLKRAQETVLKLKKALDL